MEHVNSIGISFFGLSDKELAVFDRVIAFVEKKGEKFHKSSTEMAAIFIVNDEQEAIKLATEKKKSQILITVTDHDDCATGDYNIKRPLLITRVMRAMSESRKLCQTTTQKTNNKTTQMPEEAEDTQLKKQTTPASYCKNQANQNQEKTKKPSENTDDHNVVLSDDNCSFLALVVDDSAAIRKQLEIELRETTIAADYANCGEEALNKIEEKQYDLIFLDIIMPGIDGYEVCKQLRKKKNYKRTPVIMLSGKTSPLDEVEGILAGASTYLLKPVKHKNFQDTLQRISKWLSIYGKPSISYT